MEPLVSILIPAYNASRWIGETIESARAQTCPRKEIIVVDDGSTDGTRELVRSLANKDLKVDVQDHLGAAAARNKAFTLCQGDYVQWLDADDLLGRDKLEHQIRRARERATERTLISSGWANFMYRPEKARFRPSALWCDLTPAEWLIRKLSQNLQMQTGTWLVSRALTVAAGPWDTRLLGDDDGEYSCRLLRHCDGITFEPASRVYYRSVFARGLSFIGVSDRKREAQFASMQMHIRFLRSLEDSERSRAACVTYLQNWLIHFYPERMDIVRQAHVMAEELGGKLTDPYLSWKYTWLRSLWGWRAAKLAQYYLPGIKLASLASCDRMLHRFNRMRGKPISI